MGSLALAWTERHALCGRCVDLVKRFQKRRKILEKLNPPLADALFVRPLVPVPVKARSPQGLALRP
jgi:hypothetical protein